MKCVIQIAKGAFAGACLADDHETFTYRPKNWATFDSSIEAESIAQRMPFPVSVQCIGFARTDSPHNVES